MIKEIKNNPGLRVTLVGAASNILLAIVKFLAGYFGHSKALIADAVHSLSDLFTDLVAGFSHQIGRQPRDEGHPYGHGRAETIGAALIGAAIIAAAVGIAYDIWVFIQSGSSLRPEWFSALGALFSIFVNEWLYHYTRKVGVAINSPTIIANAWHHRTDALSSIAAFVGVLGAVAGYPVMDSFAGIVVAVMVGKVGYDILRGGLRDLMDSALDEEHIGKIKTIIKGIPDVVGLHELRARRLGGKILIDVHILVLHDALVSEGHNIAEKVRRELIAKIDNVEEVLVHVDPEADTELERIYPVSRKELMNRILPLIESTGGALEFSKMQVDYYQGRTQVEVIVRIGTTGRMENIKETVEELEKKIEALAAVDGATVYLNF